MNSQYIFSFETTEPSEYVGKTYQEAGQQYLTVGLSGCSIIKRKANYLLVPDDNSLLANHLKNDFHYDYSFNTPFSNLKFKPGFWKNSKGSISYDCLIVKDTSQVKKDKEKVLEFPTSPLTFKVLNQKKKPVGESGKYYEHELEIEPVDLGIERMPKITRIDFSFIAPPLGASAVEKGLEKTWLYNHKILDESVGKTFNVGVKRWKLAIENGDGYLTFADDWDFDLDSFQEKAVGDNKQPNPNQPKTPIPKPKKDNNKTTSQTPEGSNTLKTILIISGVIGGLILVGFLFYFWKKKGSHNRYPEQKKIS